MCDHSCEQAPACKYERLLERNRQYHREHKEEISTRRKLYYAQNKEKIKLQRKERYQNGEAERLKEPVPCDICGVSVQKMQFKRHLQSRRHQAAAENSEILKISDFEKEKPMGLESGRNAPSEDTEV